MRTMPTLNLPASTSGIWRLVPVPAAQAVPPPAAPLAAAPLVPGLVVELHAPTASAAPANRLASRSRVLAMDPPPHRLADRTRGTARPHRHAQAQGRPRGFPAPRGQDGRIASGTSLVEP